MLQGFFNYDNDIWRFVGRLADIMVLNLLWIVCSLPIVTFGISTTALYYCTLKIVKDEDDGNFRMFFRSFKRNWKEGLIIWLILLPVLGILLLDHRFFTVLFQNHAVLRFLLQGITDALILLWIFVFLYVWPLLSRFENSWQKVMLHALLMSIHHLPYTLGILALDFASILLVFFLLRLVPMFVPVFFILGFPLLAWMNSAFFRRIFARYEKKKPEEQEREEDNVQSEE